MHRLLCLITLALAASTLAFADTQDMNEDLSTTRIEPAEPDLSKGNDGDATQATAQQVPDVSLDLLCDTLASSAHESGLPVSFFSNLIWQESRFVFRAVSPAGALGIAQFMPKTAAAIGLTNPFDPLMALPASARLLGTLFQRFGNLGLAAAAYNAGEGRVNNWLSNKTGSAAGDAQLRPRHYRSSSRALESSRQRAAIIQAGKANALPRSRSVRRSRRGARRVQHCGSCQGEDCTFGKGRFGHTSAIGRQRPDRKDNEAPQA